LVESTDMPLISMRFRSGSTPRIDTCDPSPKSRESCTPVTRDSASPTFLSGNWPMSSATMESVTVLALSLRSIADATDLRVPATYTTEAAWSAAGVAGAPAWVSCANAPCAARPASTAATARAQRVARMTGLRFSSLLILSP
jgi:hypothetical protein